MDFLLDPEIVFLNHGSFGACPRVVHDEYQRIQRHLEQQPVRFMQRELPELITAARQSLAEFLGADHDEVVFVPNPTFAVNEIARSLKLGPGDEVLTSDQEYGACHNAWRFMAGKSGFSIVQQSVALPVRSDTALVDDFWKRVNDNTKVIFLSHITSPTALTIPVEEICRRARQRGILTVIDGAHAPGQLDVDLHRISADFYTATCHKWMCAPKGTAFLFVRRELQPLIEPLVVGWGWGADRTQFRSGSDFVDAHQWLGTHDPSGYLTVPTAIQFQSDHDWKSVRQACHRLAVQAVEQAADRVADIARVHDDRFFQQLALLAITKRVDAPILQRNLYSRHRIEVPVIDWKDRQFVRVSVQAYNSAADIERLVAALASELTRA